MTDFVCAVPFAPFWAPKGWIETNANKIATKIKGKDYHTTTNKKNGESTRLSPKSILYVS